MYAYNIEDPASDSEEDLLYHGADHRYDCWFTVSVFYACDSEVQPAPLIRRFDSFAPHLAAQRASTCSLPSRRRTRRATGVLPNLLTCSLTAPRLAGDTLLYERLVVPHASCCRAHQSV